MTARKIMSLVLAVVAVVTVFLVLGPTQVGGPASYVVVDGTSMEPTYQDGDLVIARHRDSYEVGDIVTYIAPDGQEGDFRVIHRIIAATADGYSAQGDNRDVVDDWVITDDDILGASMVRIPVVGGVARTPQDRAVVLGLGVGLLALGIGGTKVRRRRRRYSGTHVRRRSIMSTASKTAGTTLAGPRWAPLALMACLVTAGLLGWLAVSALRMPTTSTTVMHEGEYTHHVDFTYTARAAPSLVYPDGNVGPMGPVDAQASAHPEDEQPEEAADEFESGIRPPQVLYSGLVDELVVVIDYYVDADDVASLDGEHRTFLVLETGDGWTSREPLGSPATIEAGTSNIERTIDLRAARGTLEQVAELAGASSSTALVSVESEVTVGGEIGGEPVADVITESFDVRLGSPVLQPTGDLARQHPVHRTSDTLVNNRVAGMSVPLARGLGVIGLLGSLAGAAWLAAMVLLGWRRPEHEAIAARHGALIVTVHDDPVRGAQPMRVGSFGALARLAKREHTAILHEPRPGGRHRYVVPDGLMAFCYETAGDEPADDSKPDAAAGMAASAPKPLSGFGPSLGSAADGG